MTHRPDHQDRHDHPTPDPPIGDPDSGPHASASSTSPSLAEAQPLPSSSPPQKHEPSGTGEPDTADPHTTVPALGATGAGGVRVPTAAVRARELAPYLLRHPEGRAHLEHGALTLDQAGQPRRRPDRRWDYSAPGLRGWCACGWAGPDQPQAQLPAGYTSPVTRGVAWRHVNRSALAAIDAAWVEHVHNALPTLAVTIATTQRELITGEQNQAVARARRHGASWNAIAAATRLTRQAAHARWRHLDPAGPSPTAAATDVTTNATDAATDAAGAPAARLRGSAGQP